jgi:hypothetical protein
VETLRKDVVGGLSNARGLCFPTRLADKGKEVGDDIQLAFDVLGPQAAIVVH